VGWEARAPSHMPPKAKKKKKPKMHYQAYQDVPKSAPAARRDPFYVVKEKVQIRATKLTDEYDRWKDIFATSNTGSNSEFEQLTQSIKMTIKSVKIDLNDLQQTIAIVESKRARFKDIDDAELDSRKQFVNDMRAMTQTCEETLTSDRTLSKIKTDKRKNNRRDLFDTTSSSDVSLHMGGEGRDYKQNQKQMEEKQDVILDDMMGALERLGDIGGTINVELTAHNKTIQELDEDVEKGMGSMGVVMGKMTKLLGTSNKGKLCCILFLFLLAVVLLFCVIYT